MKLLFKQRTFSWFDNYDIYDRAGNSIYTVEGKMPWGHRLVTYNACKGEIGEIKEGVFTFLPRFRMYMNDEYFDMIEKELSFFRPKSHLSYNDQAIYGDLMEWEYDVISEHEGLIMHASKELFHFMSTYVLNIQQEGHVLLALMIVLVIDAAKHSHNR